MKNQFYFFSAIFLTLKQLFNVMKFGVSNPLMLLCQRNKRLGIQNTEFGCCQRNFWLSKMCLMCSFNHVSFVWMIFDSDDDDDDDDDEFEVNQAKRMSRTFYLIWVEIKWTVSWVSLVIVKLLSLTISVEFYYLMFSCVFLSLFTWLNYSLDF